MKLIGVHTPSDNNISICTMYAIRPKAPAPAARVRHRRMRIGVSGIIIRMCANTRTDAYTSSTKTYNILFAFLLHTTRWLCLIPPPYDWIFHAIINKLNPYPKPFVSRSGPWPGPDPGPGLGPGQSRSGPRPEPGP